MKVMDVLKGLFGGSPAKGTKGSAPKSKSASSSKVSKKKAPSKGSKAKTGNKTSVSKGCTSSPWGTPKGTNSKGGKNNTSSKAVKGATSKAKKDGKREFPNEFPFWARFKVNKNRTTLVIDAEPVKDRGKVVDGFVHREATHSGKKDYEKIEPNPDKSDFKPMYLKRPTKRPKREFLPHNKKLDMPEHLKQRYEKNNKKKS